MTTTATTQHEWLPNPALRALAEWGWRNQDIARANRDATGYEPTRSAVTRRLQRIGVPPRHMSHKDLIPWRIRPEHAHERIYYGLQAIDRQRKGLPMSRQDAYRAAALRAALTDRIGPFVVDYRPDISPEHGFILVPAEPGDTGITRRSDQR